MPVSISGDGAITGLELEAFEDVDVGSGAADGDVLTYDASGDLWIPQEIVLPAGVGSNVVQTVKTDMFTTTSTSHVLITGMEATITPTTATSKILLIATGTGGNTSAGNTTQLQFFRGATAIGISTAGVATNDTQVVYTHSTAAGVPFAPTFLDSPSTTSAITYSLHARVNGGTGVIGRIGVNTNHGAITTLTAIEVAA